MNIAELTEQLEQQPNTLTFETVMAVIEENFNYQPSRFVNGLGEQAVVNEAGTNEGSCKIFALGKALALSETQTLACFGSFYRNDVLANPDGSDHGNIRAFMVHGWTGIQFDGPVLTPRSD
jgi:hypothetical protein